MDEKILHIINTIIEEGRFTKDYKELEAYRVQLRELVTKGVIKSTTNGYVFDELGYHIKEIGGYENYLIELELKMVRETESHNATIDSAKAAVDSAQSAKATKIWGIFTSLVGLASFLWAIHQTSEVDNLKKDVQKGDSLRILQGQVIEKQNQRLSKIEQTLNRLQSKK